MLLPLNLKNLVLSGEVFLFIILPVEMCFYLSIKFFLFSALAVLLFSNTFSQNLPSGFLENGIDSPFLIDQTNQTSIDHQFLNLLKGNNNFQSNFKRQHLLEMILKRENWNFYCDSCSSNSDLRFVTGSKKTNGLRLIHEQKLGSFGSFVLDFSTKSSIGFFQRDKYNSIFLKPLLKLYSANKKYNFSAGYKSYKFKRELNGGLSSDSLFLESKNLSANLNPINLKSSESALKNRSIFLSNSYSFYKIMPDSIIRTKFKLKEVLAKSQYNYSINKYGFYSQDKNFFVNYFLDTIQTKDTLAFKSQSHLFGFGVDFGSDFTSFQIMPYFLNGQHEYKNLESKSGYKSYSTGLKVNYYNKEKKLHGEFQYQNDNVETFDVNHNKISGRVDKAVVNDYWVFAEFNFSENFTPLLMRRYYSNNFIWNNNFDNEKKVLLSAGLSSLTKDNVLTFEYTLIRNYIYFNALAVPDQYNNGLSIVTVDLTKEIDVGQFKFIPKVRFTSVSNINVYHYPIFVFKPEVNYSRDVFKKKLNFSTGIRFFYFSSFYADVYMPVTDQYYLQSEIKTGNYPMLDFFLKLKIKRAQLFLELNHLNEGLSGKNYFLTPHYPMPGRNIFFGINWQLIN